MRLSRLSSSQKQKVSGIKKMIASGEYQGAVAELAMLQSTTNLTGEPGKTLDYLSLQALNRLQWLVEAAPVVERLVRHNGLTSLENLEVALFYVLTGKTESAERFMRRAISLDRRSQLLASELAILYEQQGCTDKALAIYDRILESQLGRKKMDAVGSRVLLRLTGLRALEKTEIERLVAMCDKYAGEDVEVSLLSGLARSYSTLGEREKEIQCLQKANRLKDIQNESQLVGHTIEASRAKIKGIQLLFDRPQPEWMQDYATSEKTPIFVLGMPRSGTTLLEQILGAHSQVGNTGESRAMGIAFKRCLLNKSLLAEDEGSALPFLRYKALGMEDSQSIISYYDAYQALLSKQPIVTDKELSNIDRVGMILQFYPRAKFIVVRRHPLDVCVSILQQDFSQAWFSASSLKIVQEYEAYYDKADHWQKLYPDSITSVRYEALVSSFEATVLGILDFVGLSWEPGISEFHSRSNSVRTPSLSQVRTGINSKSVEKWRQYTELIKPAEKYLEGRNNLL